VKNGFISLGIAGYIAITGAAAVLLMGLAYKLQGDKLDRVQRELATCSERYAQALALIDRQNRAVKALENAAKEAQGRAKAAQEAAAKANQGLAKERERLAALAKKPPPGPCQAGQAVKRIREGL